MEPTNARTAWELLFTDPENGEELRCVDKDSIFGSSNGLEIFVTNKKGDRTWKHTIKTEEV